MTTKNRKIRRGTLDHNKDPFVVYYDKLYPHIGRGLIFQALKLFGDSKYTHQFCEYLKSRKAIEPNISKYTFEELHKDFENGNHDIIIETKINIEDD